MRKLTDILLFGIFHFFEEKIDFSSDTIQRQLDDLSYAVSKFSPSAVAVEFRWNSTVKELLHEAKITGVRVADVVLKFDADAVTPVIHEETHVNHAGKGEPVYCIDFEVLASCGCCTLEFIIES